MREVNGWWLPDEDRHFEPALVRDGGYQGDARSKVLKLVKKFDVAVDGGTHVGFWARDLCAKFKHVHAFEPVIEHCDCLVKNVPGHNLSIYRKALGDARRQVSMDINPRNSGAAFVKASGDYRVHMTTLDSYGFPTVDFIKLDVESWELYALKGARETLLRCKPVVCIEQSAHRNNDTGRFDAQAYLEDLGMKYADNVRKDFFFVW